MEIFLHIFLIVIAFLGFLLVVHVHRKKATDKPFVCPVGADCHTVVHSEYSKFFGIPVEYIGMLYYGLTAVVYSVFLAYPGLATELAVFLLIGIALTSFFFSAYLTFLQAFVIRSWCSWCLTSAFISSLILLCVVLVSDFGFVYLLTQYTAFISALNLLGMALGVGVATVTGILFYNFLRDFKISIEESAVLKILSEMVWFALFLIAISAVGMFIIDTNILLDSKVFAVKFFVFLVLVVNSLALNLSILPKLIGVSFSKKCEELEPQEHKVRRLSYALIATSLISWYFMFFTGFLPGNIWGFATSPVSQFSLYILFLSVALTVSQLLERKHVV